MSGAEKQAREQVLQAALRLQAEGLIERTWGNISARVSKTQFVITPSGRAYETLTEDQLVLVNLADCTYEGQVKPSSEKGIHADAYRLRPEVNFVIHTHQYWASIAGVSEKALTGFIHPALGKRVPCAAYGLPGTKLLRRAVAMELEAWPDCRAFLLCHHGALCLGRDMKDAFSAAQALEEVCKKRVCEEMGESPLVPVPPELGSSRRKSGAFLLTRGGVTKRFRVNGRSLPSAAALHGAVYRAGEFRCAVHETAPEVLAVCNLEDRLQPYVDDLAQIAGADILCVPAEPRRIQTAMRGRNAVLIRGMGALCAGKSESDVEAVCALLRKGCAARLYAKEVPNCRPLGAVDARLQRLIYQASYERKKDTC